MIKIIKEVSKKEFKDFLYHIDLEDKNLYEEVNNGNVFGVFQFDGNTASKLTNKIKPRNFEEIVAVSSLARPGTIDFAEEYNENKETGKHKYPDKIHDLLSTTYGIILYQEQLMSIFNKIGNFTLEETNCVTGDTKIITSLGIKTIKEIVEKKLNISILTLNEKNLQLEWKEINYYFNNGKKKLIKINLENGEYIKCTPEHKIYTKNRGWIEAQFLKESDELFHYK